MLRQDVQQPHLRAVTLRGKISQAQLQKVSRPARQDSHRGMSQLRLVQHQSTRVAATSYSGTRYLRWACLPRVLASTPVRQPIESAVSTAGTMTKPTYDPPLISPIIDAHYCWRDTGNGHLMRCPECGWVGWACNTHDVHPYYSCPICWDIRIPIAQRPQCICLDDLSEGQKALLTP